MVQWQDRFTLHLSIIIENKIIHEGPRNKIDGLCDFNIPILPYNNTALKLNYTIIRDKIQQDLAQYFHACLFSPSISTLTKGIQTETYCHGQ